MDSVLCCATVEDLICKEGGRANDNQATGVTNYFKLDGIWIVCSSGGEHYCYMLGIGYTT